MIAVLEWCAIALAGAATLSVCVLAVRRVLLARTERSRTEAEQRLRPLALALIDGSDIDASDLSERDAEVLAGLLGRYGRSLRGASIERIAAFFEQNGWVDREIERLQSRRWWHRATAAYVLGNAGSAEAIPALRHALGDPNRDVRSTAARSLGRLGAVDAVEQIVYAFVHRRLPQSVAGQALLSIGPDAVFGLRPLEAAIDPRIRAFAVELVGLLGGASDGPLVLGRLRDSSAEVRAKAALALGRLGAEEGAAQLRAALDDRIPFVRTQAAHALAAVGDHDAVPDLLKAARNDAFDPARAAAAAVARLDARAVRSAAADPDAGPHLREAADLLGGTV